MDAVQGYLASPSASEAGGSYQDVNEQRIADMRFGNWRRANCSAGRPTDRSPSPRPAPPGSRQQVSQPGG
jgi:hypothetical protein